MSLAQEISSEYTNGLDFTRSNNEKLTDYHEIASTNHLSTQDYKYNTFEVDSSNDYEDLKLPEVFHRQSNGNFFCKACYITLQGGPNITCLLKHHLTGSSHNFFLQVYKNISEAAILVTEAMKRGTFKKHRGLRFFCRSCSLSLEYNSLSLLAGHLKTLEHQANAKNKDSPSTDSYIKPLQTSASEEKETTIEAMEETIDELTVMSCGLCRAEVPAVNIDMHAISAKHRANIQKLENETTNKILITNLNVMRTEEAIEFGIVKEEDVMTYFCNACNKLLPTDGTMNPLKTHLDSANHMTAARFDREELKNTVKKEMFNGYIVFKFKAKKEIPEYLDEPTISKDTMTHTNNLYQVVESSQDEHTIPKDTMTHENDLYQGVERSQDDRLIHDYEPSDDKNGVDCTYKEPHKTPFQASMAITTIGDYTVDRSQQRRGYRKKKRGLKYKDEHQHQPEVKYKNEWANPHGNNQVINTTNKHTPYKSRPKAPPPPSMRDCYENENYVNPPPQQSYQQYSTESEVNPSVRWDYNQRETSHSMVESRDAFRDSQSYSNPSSLRRTEVYGYQNAETEIQPVYLTERNMERVSTIENTSKDSNETVITEHPFSPFKAILILGCLCDDLGLFGETVKAICKNALDDKDNILQIFKEMEVRMTMKIVADKLRKLAVAAVDEPSKEKFKVGLEKVMLLLQYSVDA